MKGFCGLLARMVCKRLKRFLRALLFGSVSACALFILGLRLNPPPLEEARREPGGGVLRDSEGNILRVSLDASGRDCRPLGSVDEAGWCARALVAAEDRRFYSHFGADPLALLRASRQNLFSWRRVSGASTLSMQAARLARPGPRTWKNKLGETFSAIRLDWAMGKEGILLCVLNRAPMGSNLVGVGAGAEGWFGKPAQNLSLAEAALLAGLAQSPTRLRPDRNLAGAVKRQHYVLDRMAALGMISEAQCADAKAQPLEFRRSPRPFHAPWFCDFALRAMEGERPREPLNRRTTLDPRVQRHVENALLPRPGLEGIDFAAVVVRVDDGALVAMSCSGDYFKQRVNLATAPRAAGSTLKPFAFAMAFDQGLLTPEALLYDVPVAFEGYLPRNFDNTFSHRVSAADALAQSLNIPALHVLSLVGQPAFHRLLGNLRLTSVNRPAAHYGAGLVIGNAAVRLVELANAYAVFGRGGVFMPLRVEPGAASSRMPLFAPETARRVTDILSGPERARDAVGHVADAALPRFAWKTGTSAGFRDAWTIAWDARLVVGVWAGHRGGGVKNDERVTGRRIAANRAWDIIRLLEVSTEEVKVECQNLNLETSLLNLEPFSAPLRIVQPAPESVFVLSGALPRAMQKIAVRAHSETPAVLHWFVDGVFWVSQPSGQPFLYTPEPGAHTLTCTSEKGDSASVRVRVK